MDARSKRNLAGVKQELVDVVRAARDVMDARDDGLSFIVIEGVRTLKRQAELVEAGASWTMNSKHITGDAVDLAATVKGVVRWDWPLYSTIAKEMKLAAVAAKVHIVWGGDWKKRDGPHFELAVMA